MNSTKEDKDCENNKLPTKRLCICTTISLTMKMFVVDMAKYLHEKRGYDITLICSCDDEFSKTLPEYLHYIPINMKRGYDLSAFLSVLEFYKVFKQNRFDMVQYSTPNAALYASIAAKLSRIPIRLYCQWGVRYVGLSGIMRSVMKHIEKMICHNSTIIRAQSPLNMEFSIDEKLCKPSKIGVVGYGGTIGVDTEIFNIKQKKIWRSEIRRKYNVRLNKFVFGFIGRISIDKGCRELLSAFKFLCEKGYDALLFIVGPEDSIVGIDNSLLTWARESTSVIFTGYVERNEMCKYYSSIDVLVHPTYREGFGMVLQEAGALGIPSITTKVPGASEVFIDGISTILVEAKNSIQLADAMEKLYFDRELVLSLGENVYDHTIKRYDRHIMLENQIKDYQSILGER